MTFDALSDFQFAGDFPLDTIRKYEGVVPTELLELWRTCGLGTFANGYMKIINPDDYNDILDKSYYAKNESIPIFATGFADIIVLRKNKFVGIVNYRKRDTQMHTLFFKRFLVHFNTTESDKAFLDNALFCDAVKLLGNLEYDECFGYVPLLALGGKESVENLQKMKMKQHIEMLAEISGRIG